MKRSRLYRHMLTTIRACGRECGYAIGVHGSKENDLDLIAAPWTETAVPTRSLVEELARRLGAYVGADNPKAIAKPHGRKAYSIIFLRGDVPTGRKPLYVDVSVMPRMRTGLVVR